MLLVKLNLIIFQLYELLTKYFNWPVIKFQMFFLKHNYINSFCNTVTCQYLYGPANKAFCCRCQWGMCHPVLAISTLIQTNFFTIPFSHLFPNLALKFHTRLQTRLLKEKYSCHRQPNNQVFSDNLLLITTRVQCTHILSLLPIPLLLFLGLFRFI